MPRTSLRFDRIEFEERVGALLVSLQIRPKNKTLFTLACTHRSVLNESSQGYHESNERLEFLGDAVLELAITERLFLDFPKKPEGELTDIRSALVRGRNLALIASRLGFSDTIQLSRGESLAKGHENAYILANTFEAVIWALYLDVGFDRARDFILAHVYETLPQILEQGLYVDPKSHLQELTQGIWGVTPTYMIVREEGRDHNKAYHIAAYLDGIMLGVGIGTSKKKGEQEAAENAISLKNDWIKQIRLPKKISAS